MNRVITARTDPQTARAYWTMSRGDSERAFRAARRHSRVVRILRIAIPLAVVLGLTGISLVTYFNPLRMLAKLPIDVGNLVVSGTKITMEQPRLSGFTATRAPMSFTADAAAQDLTKPDIVELRNIHAKVADAGQEHDGNVGDRRRLRHQGRDPQARREHRAQFVDRLSGPAERGDGRYPQGQRGVRPAGRD